MFGSSALPLVSVAGGAGFGSSFCPGSVGSVPGVGFVPGLFGVGSGVGAGSGVVPGLFGAGFGFGSGVGVGTVYLFVNTTSLPSAYETVAVKRP